MGAAHRRFAFSVEMAALGVVIWAIAFAAASCTAAEQQRAAPAVHAVAGGAAAVGHPEVAAAVEGGWKLWQVGTGVAGAVAAAWGARKAHRAHRRRKAAKTGARG